MKKENVLVTEISDIDNLQHEQLRDLIGEGSSGCGSGYGSGSEESQLYVKKGSGIYTIDNAPYTIGISWSAGPVTGLYRTSISHTVNYSNKMEMISDSLNFVWGAGYTIHFSGTLEFKYWTAPFQYQIAYHSFNDAIFLVPTEYWG